jgi:hypothetical protein
MPTQTQVQQIILSAEWKRANLIFNRYTALTAGFKTYYENEIRRYRYLIAAVTRQYQLGDYTSTNFQIVYDCLSTLVGIDTSVNTIDPNYKGPNTIINVVSGGGGSTVNSTQILFSNQTTVSITGYQAEYATEFGKNPLSVQIFVSDGVGGFAPDYGTAPDFTYAVPNDPSSGVSSITWGYPVPTSGYISIFGVQQ